MSHSKYLEFVRSVESHKDSAVIPPNAINALGDALAGAGEMASALKKHIFYGKPFPYKIKNDKMETQPEPSTISGQRLRLLHSLLGIIDEAAELSQWLLKNDLSKEDHQMDLTNLAEEFGDLFFYVTLGLDANGLTLERLCDTNIAKLMARYPTGTFRESDTNNRNRENEKKVMEQTLETV